MQKIYNRFKTKLQKFFNWLKTANFSYFFGVDSSTPTPKPTVITANNNKTTIVKPSANEPNQADALPKSPTPKTNNQPKQIKPLPYTKVESRQTRNNRYQPIDGFLASLNQQLNNKKMHNVSLKTIPSPGVTIHTDIFDKHQNPLKIYALNKDHQNVRITEDGQVIYKVFHKLKQLQQQYPNEQIEFDDAIVKKYGAKLLTNPKTELVVDTNVVNFPRDLKHFLELLATLESYIK